MDQPPPPGGISTDVAGAAACRLTVRVDTTAVAASRHWIAPFARPWLAASMPGDTETWANLIVDVGHAFDTISLTTLDHKELLNHLATKQSEAKLD